MNNEYGDCLKRGKLKPFSRGAALVSKELETAIADLERAQKTYREGDFKWATIQPGFCNRFAEPRRKSAQYFRLKKVRAYSQWYVSSFLDEKTKRFYVEFQILLQNPGSSILCHVSYCQGVALQKEFART